MVWENGFTFLHVDGRCRYWVFGTSQGASEVGETRSGMLSAVDALRLERELRYADWPTLKGEWRSPYFDASPDVFTDGTSTISCQAKCSFEGAPAAVSPLYPAIDGWLDRLGQAGQPLAGAVRVAVVNLQDSFAQWPHKTAAWPLAAPMASFVIPYDAARPGPAPRLEPPGADQLRALRTRQRNQEFNPATVGIVIPVRQGAGPLHGLYLRDCSFEDANGLVAR